MLFINLFFRRKKVKIIDGDSVNDRKDVSDTTVSPDESVGKTQKGNKLKKVTSSETSKKNVTKRKTAPSKQQSVEFTPNGEASSPKKKQSKKAAKPAVKKKSRTGLSVANGEENEGVQGADLIKSKDNLEKTSSGQTQPRPKKLREKNPKLDIQSDVQDIHKNDAEVSREKALNTKQNIAKPRTATPSRNSGTQKQNDKNVVGEETLLSDLKRSSTKGNEAELGKRNKTRGKGIKSVNFLSGSSSELNIKEKDIIPPGGRKRPKNNTNSGSLSERKIHVFDHLFCELKKCPGLSKVTISSAAELLLKVTADKLKNLVPGLPSKSRAKTSVASSKQTEDNVTSSPAKAKASSSVSETKRRRTESEKPPLHSSSPQKTGPGKSEQVKLSQAAEALVSFRTNPTILRQEKIEADIIPSSRSPDKDIANMNANPEKNSAPKDTYTPDKVAEAPMQSIVTTINELIASQAVNSCYVNAPSQSHAASQLQSGLVVQGHFHQPVRFPPSIEANLQQVANVQQNLLNLSHLTSQLNSAPTGPPQISPRFTAPCSVNPSSSAVMSSRMMNPTGIPNIQALFCRPTQPPNIQTSMAVQSPAPSLSPNSNDQQAHPQQPLKGMEDVVSCVGSRSTANLLWNIKPATPVVYLTSPQTLSGVRARNFIPQSEGHGPLPFTTGVANVQSVGIPKASLNSASTSVLTLGKVTLVSQASPLSTSHPVNMSNQRPILPREQRMPPVFSSGLQSTSQLPVTTVVGQIPRNIPPVVRPGNMPVQLSHLGMTSPLNTRQMPAMVVTQGPCVTTVQSTATVTTAVGMAPVSAKQAVKKFVHERTKSAELKRTSSLNNLLLNEAVTATAVSNPSSQNQGSQSMDQTEKQSTAKHTEFNLHQAASALLSIGSQDGLDATDALQPGGEGDDSLDEHEDEVVFTSKGVFRVGDVDVDPKYNRIGRGKNLLSLYWLNILFLLPTLMHCHADR